MPYREKGESEDVRSSVIACVDHLDALASAPDATAADKVIEQIVNGLRGAAEVAVGSPKSMHDVLHGDVPEILVKNFAEPAREQPVIARECFMFIGALIDTATAAKRSKALICNRPTAATEWVVRTALDGPRPSSADARLGERLEGQMAATAVMELLARDPFGRAMLLDIAPLERMWGAARACASGAISSALLKVIGALGSEAELHGLVGSCTASLTDLYNGEFDFARIAQHALDSARLADGQLVELSPKQLWCFGVRANCERLRFEQNHVELELALAGRAGGSEADEDGGAQPGAAIFIARADLASSSWSKDIGALSLQLRASSIERVKYTLDFADGDETRTAGGARGAKEASSIVFELDAADARSVARKPSAPNFLGAVLALCPALETVSKMYVASKAAVVRVPVSARPGGSQPNDRQHEAVDGERTPALLELRASKGSTILEQRRASEPRPDAVTSRVDEPPPPQRQQQPPATGRGARLTPRDATSSAALGGKATSLPRSTSVSKGSVRAPTVTPAGAAHVNAKGGAHDSFRVFESVKSLYPEDGAARILATTTTTTLPGGPNLHAVAAHAGAAAAPQRGASTGNGSAPKADSDAPEKGAAVAQLAEAASAARPSTAAQRGAPLPANAGVAPALDARAGGDAVDGAVERSPFAINGRGAARGGAAAKSATTPAPAASPAKGAAQQRSRQRAQPARPAQPARTSPRSKAKANASTTAAAQLLAPPVDDADGAFEPNFDDLLGSDDVQLDLAPSAKPATSKKGAARSALQQPARASRQPAKKDAKSAAPATANAARAPTRVDDGAGTQALARAKHASPPQGDALCERPPAKSVRFGERTAVLKAEAAGTRAADAAAAAAALARRAAVRIAEGGAAVHGATLTLAERMMEAAAPTGQTLAFDEAVEQGAKAAGGAHSVTGALALVQMDWTSNVPDMDAELALAVDAAADDLCLPDASHEPLDFGARAATPALSTTGRTQWRAPPVPSAGTAKRAPAATATAAATTLDTPIGDVLRAPGAAVSRPTAKDRLGHGGLAHAAAVIAAKRGAYAATPSAALRAHIGDDAIAMHAAAIINRLTDKAVLVAKRKRESIEHIDRNLLRNVDGLRVRCSDALDEHVHELTEQNALNVSKIDAFVSRTEEDLCSDFTLRVGALLSEWQSHNKELVERAQSVLESGEAKVSALVLESKRELGRITAAHADAMRHQLHSSASSTVLDCFGTVFKGALTA